MQQGIKKLQWFEYLKVVFLEILNPLSLSTVLLNSRDWSEFWKFHALKINLAIGFIQENTLECVG